MGEPRTACIIRVVCDPLSLTWLTGAPGNAHAQYLVPDQAKECGFEPRLFSANEDVSQFEVRSRIIFTDHTGRRSVTIIISIKLSLRT